MDAFFFHPKVVHIPIALSVLMPFISGAVALAWRLNWLRPRTWVLVVALQAVLVGSSVVAVQTGEAEEDRVEHVAPEEAIEEHEEIAEAFSVATGAVLGVMLLALLAARTKVGLPIAVAAALGTLVVLALGYRTGEAGGALVYRHGAANAYGASDSSAAADRERHDEDHDDD
jgi:uncharacterized membrane protein